MGTRLGESLHGDKARGEPAWGRGPLGENLHGDEARGEPAWGRG